MGHDWVLIESERGRLPGHLSSVSIALGDEQINLRLTEPALSFLVKHGYHQDYGARPLKRAIQRYIEDPLSEKILLAEFANLGAGAGPHPRQGPRDHALLRVVRQPPARHAPPSGARRCRTRRPHPMVPSAMRLVTSGRIHGLMFLSHVGPKCTIVDCAPQRHRSSAAWTAELPPPTTTTSCWKPSCPSRKKCVTCGRFSPGTPSLLGVPKYPVATTTVRARHSRRSSPCGSVATAKPPPSRRTSTTRSYYRTSIASRTVAAR